MGRKKKIKGSIKHAPTSRRGDAISSEFSRNFEQRVAPRLSPEKTELIRQTFDYSIINNMSQPELSNLARQLAIMANQRIGIYKHSKYYEQTQTGYQKPIPEAYRILEENKGDSEKYNVNKFLSMKVQELRKEIRILGHFLSAESSYASGQERIMNERYNNMVRGIKNHMNRTQQRQFEKDYGSVIRSDEFQRKYWEVYNKLDELVGGKTSWYEKDTYMSEITKILTEPFYRNLSADELVGKLYEKVNKMYEESEKQRTLDENIFLSSFRTGSNK